MQYMYESSTNCLLKLSPLQENIHACSRAVNRRTKLSWTLVYTLPILVYT